MAGVGRVGIVAVLAVLAMMMRPLTMKILKARNAADHV
jgi:hypothetical protein